MQDLKYYFLFPFTAFKSQHPEYLRNIFTANITFVKKSSFYAFPPPKGGKRSDSNFYPKQNKIQHRLRNLTGNLVSKSFIKIMQGTLFL